MCEFIHSGPYILAFLVGQPKYSKNTHLEAGTSWRPPPCRQAAAGSWGPERDRRRRRPEHLHAGPSTGGQHPVGSMPGKKKKAGGVTQREILDSWSI